MVTNNSSNYKPTQYNTQTGGPNGTLNDVAPGTAGQVLTSNGASAQPTFQTASAGSTGTFTPVLAFGGASTGIVYNIQTGKYHLIGNCVTFNICLNLTNKGSSTGNATITGLPFSSANDGALYNYVTNMLAVTATSATYYFSEITLNSNFFSLYYVVASTGFFTVLTNTNFANNSDIRIQGSYFV